MTLPSTKTDDVTVWDYLERRWDTVLELAIEHLLLVLGSVLIATIIGVGLGLLVHRHRAASTVLVTVTNTAFTVPSLAYFSVFLVWFGLGLQPSVWTLVIYALLPIVRNTITGLAQVDQAIVRAATGMGMGRGQALLRIELPLALPVIMSGVRIGAVLTVGIAAVAAYVGGPGLGSEIFGGLGAIGSARGVPQAIVGTLAIVVVTVIVDLMMAASHRVLTPKGLR
ncbi:ABC transporter permease [Egicoccus sp. AB-alg2]|uniref:ABC transporter permease n=1 Tax=Egicoccus sp. AB-alg2 TaxID=3242693 RepID=UPI00359E2195